MTAKTNRFTMATLTDRLPSNVAGPFYVDTTCIDCDQCRVVAPDFFGRDEETGMSFVRRQPATADEMSLVEQAMSECATSSIGNDGA